DLINDTWPEPYDSCKGKALMNHCQNLCFTTDVEVIVLCAGAERGI
ncbi:MAG: hypothetical protein QG610_166, partial [Euryarchaeota archaeon]|nr:hypothetical protein [Euryarchaeota archaeon]